MRQGAQISVWGVGTKMITGDGASSRSGVYKLAAIRGISGKWQYKLKVHEQVSKMPIPGELQVRRYLLNDLYYADQILDLLTGVESCGEIVSPVDPLRRKKIPRDTPFEEVLPPVFRDGICVYASPSIEKSKERLKEQLSKIHPGIKRFENPHEYPVGLSLELQQLRQKLIFEHRTTAAD
jgi:nicotinate phosphoribosyltransferase